MLIYLIKLIKILGALSKMHIDTNFLQRSRINNNKSTRIVMRCHKRKALQVLQQMLQLSFSSSIKTSKQPWSGRQHKNAVFMKQLPRAMYSSDKSKMPTSVLNKLIRIVFHQLQQKQKVFKNHHKTIKLSQQTKLKQRLGMAHKVNKLHASLCHKLGVLHQKHRIHKRAPHGFAYELQNKRSTANWKCSDMLTAKDFENIISKFSLCTTSPQYFWVYFFHNQLPKCPPPSLASLRVPNVPQFSLLTTQKRTKQVVGELRTVGGEDNAARISTASPIQVQPSDSLLENDNVQAPVADGSNSRTICCPARCRTQTCTHNVNPSSSNVCTLPTDAGTTLSARRSRSSAASVDRNTNVTDPNSMPQVDRTTVTTMNSRLSDNLVSRNTNVDAMQSPRSTTQQTPVDNTADLTIAGRNINNDNVYDRQSAGVRAAMTMQPQQSERGSNRVSTETTGGRASSTSDRRYPSLGNAYYQSNSDRESNFPAAPPTTTRNTLAIQENETTEDQRVSANTDVVIAELQRGSVPSIRPSIPMPRPSVTEQIKTDETQALPQLNFKELPTAATVYSTQFYKPDEIKRNRIKKHCQLKTPYFQNERYPPVYNVYTTPSMIRFRHRNVMTYNATNLKMDGNKPLSPIGARKRSLRSKREAAQNTIYCGCNNSLEEVLRPCACPDPSPEVSCCCTPSIEKCSCHTAPETTTGTHPKFPPDTRKILRRCITTGGGFDSKNVDQFFHHVQRAIKKGQISKCGNPYCGQCYTHPSEKWTYTVNKNVYKKTRCYDEQSETEENVISEEINEDAEDVEKTKPLCDYTKGKKQYDTIEERERKTKSRNRKLEVDSEELSYLLNKAFQLRKQQYDGEPCIKDSETLIALQKQDERLYRRFMKYNMHVPETQYELCEAEEFLEEEEVSGEAMCTEEGQSNVLNSESNKKKEKKPCSSDSDVGMCRKHLSAGDMDEILKRHRCDRNNAKKCQYEGFELNNWYAPLSAVNFSPTISISRIPKSFKIN